MFATASEWVDQLADAHHAGSLHGELRKLARYPVLVIDEVGYIPFEAEAANLLFQLVSSRYERVSLILTSKKRRSVKPTCSREPMRIAAETSTGSCGSTLYGVVVVLDLVVPTARLYCELHEAHQEWGPGLHEDGFGLSLADDVASSAGFTAWVKTLTQESTQITYRWIAEGDKIVGGIVLRHPDHDAVPRQGTFVLVFGRAHDGGASQPSHCV